VVIDMINRKKDRKEIVKEKEKEERTVFGAADMCI
jgi:hypothetical protein